MKIKGLILGLGLIAAAGLTGCEYMEDEPTTSGALIGAGSGALIGTAVSDSAWGTALGGVTGGLIGAGIGSQYE